MRISAFPGKVARRAKSSSSISSTRDSAALLIICIGDYSSLTKRCIEQTWNDVPCYFVQGRYYFPVQRDVIEGGPRGRIARPPVHLWAASASIQTLKVGLRGKMTGVSQLSPMAVNTSSVKQATNSRQANKNFGFTFLIVSTRLMPSISASSTAKLVRS